MRNLYTNHGLVLMHIWINPDVTLAEMAVALGVREGAVYRIVKELVEDGFMLKEKVGRRNRYHVNLARALDYRPLPDTTIREQIVGIATTLGMRPAEREHAATGG